MLTRQQAYLTSVKLYPPRPGKTESYRNLQRGQIAVGKFAEAAEVQILSTV